ncbi:MAG: hypothetical protein N2257_10760, partial [Thermodesulfovibrionales bacterium]|nr:hypothetical protein [Thermodesulfovibrionales bacterium]
MGLFKRGNVWWASVTHNGKQYRFSCNTQDKTEAQSIYAKVLLELRQGNLRIQRKEPKEPEAKKPSYAEYYQEQYLKWCKGRHLYYKIKRYIPSILPEWFKKLKIYQISNKEVELLQTHFMEKGYSVATCNRSLSIVKPSFT